jgi:hypothetical protein
MIILWKETEELTIMRSYSVVPEFRAIITEQIRTVELLHDILGCGLAVGNNKIAALHKRNFLVQPVLGLLLLVIFPLDWVEKLVLVIYADVLA